jgi:DNA (cytosine-5)-methyltransferase 1
MRYFSMFSGIGGFEIGIEKATRDSKHDKIGGAQEPDRKARMGFDCVGFSEIDKYAIQIYFEHFPRHKNYGDCTRIDPDKLPDFDLLVGGFPCQSFSIAGKRGGFEDTRGTLFFDIARIARVKRPQLLFLENVKGLLSHDKGRTFGTILATLSDMGYVCEWQVLNSKDFGVPQNRERVFIIGHLGGIGGRAVFPIGEANKKSNNLEYVGAIMSKQNQEWLKDGKKLSRNFPQGQRVYSVDGIASNICGDAGGLGGKTGLYATRQPLKFLQRNQKNIEGDYAFTVDGANTGGVKTGQRIRRLTPTECERLQGFPDGWTEGISDTQRYKCLGNAVTVNVIEAIAERL